MRNIKTSLVLAAVILLAGSAFADWNIEVIPAGSPADGLESYIIHTSGLNAFEALSISGVHQSNPVSFGSITSTAFADDIPEAAPSILVDIDTRLLFSRNDVVSPGTVDSESNDQTDPSNSVDAAWTPWKSGIGDFHLAGAFTMKGLECLAGLDLMQVVIPAGETVVLLGKITSPDMSMYDLADQGGIEIGDTVPEPGTILLLLAGSLCLLGVRARKSMV